MSIVGGLDIHRKQLTFDYLLTPLAGRCGAGRSARRTARILPRGWRGVSPARPRTSRWRGAPGGGMSPRSGRGRDHPARRRACGHRRAAGPQAACQDGQDRFAVPAGAAGRRAAAGMLDPAVARPGMTGAARAVSRPAGPSTPPRRSCAVLFHQGARQLGEQGLRTGEGLAHLAVSRGRRTIAGRATPMTVALDMLCRCWRATWTRCAAGLTGAARRSSPGPGSCTRGCTASARPPRWHCAAGWAGRAGSPPPQGGPVHRAGHHRLVLDRTGPPGRLSRQGPKCCAGASMRPARHTPAAAPPTTPATRRSRTGSTASAPPSPRPARFPPGRAYPGLTRRRRADHGPPPVPVTAP